MAAALLQRPVGAVHWSAAVGARGPVVDIAAVVAVGGVDGGSLREQAVRMRASAAKRSRRDK
jgi:hypothetical protein